MAQQQKFRGTLVRDGTSLHWTVVRVPFDPRAVWPERKRLRVRGEIDGCAFRTSLFSMRDGGFLLLVNKQMQKAAQLTVGSVAEIVLEPDLEERVVRMPPELEEVLRQERGLRKWHDALNESSRRWLADWVAQPKSAEARAQRAEQTAERLLLTMEGERVTPPILELAFQRQPKARAGWEAMTPLQRRQQLLGIFYYQTPESRQKRAEKAIEEALRVGVRAAAKREPPARR